MQIKSKIRVTPQAIINTGQNKQEQAIFKYFVSAFYTIYD